MQGSRAPERVIRKPKVVLENRRFPFITDFELGDKGQLLADLEIESIRLEMDAEGNEKQVFHLNIVKADLVTNKGARLDA